MDRRPIIIITGASGFIGSELAKYFSAKKWKVLALVKEIPQQPLNDVVYEKYDLNDSIDEEIFEGADYLVHCAYVKDNIEANVKGTKNLINVSRMKKFKKNIFISSFAAHKNAVSKYGKQKLEIEKFFQTQNDCVLRAGVVIGNGGMFKDMSEHIKKGKRIPLIDSGKQPFQIIHVDDLILITEKILTENYSGIFTVADTETISYKDFFSALSFKLGVKPKFISVPFFLLNISLFVAEILRIRLPAARENVLGLKNMKSRETKKDLEKLGVKIRNYKESLEKL